MVQIINKFVTVICQRCDIIMKTEIQNLNNLFIMTIKFIIIRDGLESHPPFLYANHCHFMQQAITKHSESHVKSTQR